MSEKPSSQMTSPRECVGWLCYTLASEKTSSGQLSSLRKQSATSPSPSSWWILTKLEQAKLNREIGETSQANWHSLVKMLSMLTLTGTPAKTKIDPTKPNGTGIEATNKPTVPLRGSLHQPDRTLGTALFAAGYSEHRLASLLNAREGQRANQLIRTCRFLLAKKEGFDCRELADFIFSSDPEKSPYDQVRQRVARDYFRAAVKQDIELPENL